MTDQVNCENREWLVDHLYGEETPEARRRAEAHLAVCAACAAEFRALSGVRGSLQAWSAPEVTLGFRLVRDESPRRLWSWLAARPALPLAAAATLILGLAAGLANLEIRYDASGLSIRTGRGHVDTAAASRPSTRAAGAVNGSVSSTAAPVAANAAGGAARGTTASREELQALEARLLDQLAAVQAEMTKRGQGGSAPASINERQLLERVQALIDASEIRQQRNLALRVAELARDFDMQRQTDWVRIRQNIGRIERGTEAEAAYQRELLQRLVSSSSQPPQR